MKILYIAHSTTKDGSSIALLRIIKGMKQYGIEVGVLVNKKEGYLYYELKKINVEVFCKRNYPSILSWKLHAGFFSSLKWLQWYMRMIFLVHWDVYRLIKQYKPDIVHTNTACIDYALMGCFLTRTPHVWHVRELLKGDENFKVFPSRSLLQKKMRLPFNRCVAVSRYVFEQFGMNEKDTVIYDGAITEAKTAVSESISNHPYFLTVGYISPIKQTLEVLHAFSSFAQKNSQYRLLFAGKYYPSNPYYLECIKYINTHGLTDRIQFLGERSDVKELMQHAAAVISSCNCEGFGLTVAEAMHEGTIVIGRNEAGIKEQMDNGLAKYQSEIAIRYNEVSELASAMDSVVTGNFEQQIRNAKEFVDETYTEGKNISSLFQLYCNILDKDKKK